MSRRAIHWTIGGLLVIVAVGIGIWLSVNPPSAEAYPPPGAVDVGTAQTLIRDHAADDDFVILDVRTPQEFGAGHVAPNGARILNLDISTGNFLVRLEQLDRSDKYLVYCRTGNRSAVAVERMEQLDFEWIYHMDRGIVAWQAAGLPIVAE